MNYNRKLFDIHYFSSLFFRLNNIFMKAKDEKSYHYIQSLKNTNEKLLELRERFQRLKLRVQSTQSDIHLESASSTIEEFTAIKNDIPTLMTAIGQLYLLDQESLLSLTYECTEILNRISQKELLQLIKYCFDRYGDLNAANVVYILFKEYAFLKENEAVTHLRYSAYHSQKRYKAKNKLI